MVKYKKGQPWNKALTIGMALFEEKTGKKAVYRSKITGQFEFWLWQEEKKVPKPKIKTKSKTKAKKEQKKNIILKAMSSGKKLTFRTITNRVKRTDDYVRSGLKELEEEGKIFSSKEYKSLPSGKGLSRKYKWVWQITPTSKAKPLPKLKTLPKPKPLPKLKTLPKPKIDTERFWNKMPQPQKRRSMFLTDLEYNDAYIAINKKKQWIDLPKSLQNNIKKEINARVLKEIYNLSNTEFDDVFKEKPKIQEYNHLAKKWNNLSQKKRVALLTKEHDFDNYYANEVKRKKWQNLPDQIKKDIKKYPDRIEDMVFISDELFEEYYGKRFDPDLIENGDYVNFGVYGNFYVLYRASDKNFWVTDIKHERYNKNAPGWNIRVNYAKKIIRKG